MTFLFSKKVSIQLSNFKLQTSIINKKQVISHLRLAISLKKINY